MPSIPSHVYSSSTVLPPADKLASRIFEYHECAFYPRRKACASLPPFWARAELTGDAGNVHKGGDSCSSFARASFIARLFALFSRLIDAL
jgi:hypothetical protein